MAKSSECAGIGWEEAVGKVAKFTPGAGIPSGRSWGPWAEPWEHTYTHTSLTVEIGVRD